MQGPRQGDHQIVGPSGHRGNLFFLRAFPVLHGRPAHGFDIAATHAQSGAWTVRPSYLLSYIAIQSSRLSDARFHEKFGGAWLVWEPGTWQPPSRQVTATLGASRNGPPTAPSHTDALCFHLGDSGTVRVGRAPDNDCVVSDATVSRHHCELVVVDGAWRVRAVEGRLVGLNHRPIAGETKLSPHDRLYLGDVTLTFDDALGLMARFKG